MPLYYDLNFVGALVGTPAWVYFVCYENTWPWLYRLLKATSCLISCYCSCVLLMPFYHEWRQQPVVQLNNAAPANGNAAQLQLGRLQHLPNLPGMLTDVFQCLPRVGLDACQLVSRQFRDAIEDARTTLPLYPMRVSLRSRGILVSYFASIVRVGSVTGHFFMGLRRCDSPYFRNAAISLRTGNATYARTTTDMISVFVRSLNLNERNIRFTDLKCGEVYAGELEDIFRFTDRHDIRWLYVGYKRSFVGRGCDFLSMYFAEARKRSLNRFTVSLENEAAKNCNMELQVGFRVLSELFQGQERPSAEYLMVIVPRLKGFRLLRRIYQAYERGEITRQLTIGCDSSVPLAELCPGAKPNPFGRVDGRIRVTTKLAPDGKTTLYKFSPSF
ncbi:hypothetical protein AAVH_25374 [Aphelenchoides avenae]|nr:hypothetical protein AAVH_25374 [Aphelenchus avenae]